jgi:hypothetical protein
MPGNHESDREQAEPRVEVPQQVIELADQGPAAATVIACCRGPRCHPGEQKKHMGPKAFIRAPHFRPKQFTLIDDNKDMLPADHVPIAPLPIPVTVLVRVPVAVIPIGFGVDSRAIARMHCGTIVRMDNRPIGSAGVISTIGSMNSRAAFGMDRRAITSLDCRAMTVMSCFPVFSFVGIRVKCGG